MGLHVDTGCQNWTPDSLAATYTNQLTSRGGRNTLASKSPPRNARTALPGATGILRLRLSCLTASGWTPITTTGRSPGRRTRPGMFTGSGMPMRFADTDGAMVDVYQATTQMTDESGQTYPATINALLDRAVGPEGYYGVFTANMHNDSATHEGSAAIVTAAQTRGVPVVSGRQLLQWLDGRNGSSFGSITWSGDTLHFTVAVGAGANGLRGHAPRSRLPGG